MIWHQNWSYVQNMFLFNNSYCDSLWLGLLLCNKHYSIYYINQYPVYYLLQVRILMYIYFLRKWPCCCLRSSCSVCFWSPVEVLDQIQKLHDDFLLDEKRLRNANTAIEDSMDTRQDVKHKLSMCSSRGELVSLEKKIRELSVINLNKQVSLHLQSHKTDPWTSQRAV